MTSLRDDDASLDTITKGFIDSFTNLEELEKFTEILCIEDNPYVKRKLFELLCKTIQTPEPMDIDVTHASSQSKPSTSSTSVNKPTEMLHLSPGPSRNNTKIGDFTCNICNQKFKHRGKLNRHVHSHQKTFKCFLCDMRFNRGDNLRRHERGHLTGYKKPTNLYKCQHCGLYFSNYITLFKHTQANHPQQQGGGMVHDTSTSNALDDSVHVLNVFPRDEDKYDLLTFFANIREEIKYHLVGRCEKVKHVKWYLNVQVKFVRETNEGEVDTSQPYFKSKTYILLSKDDVSDHDINEAYQKQFQSFDEYIARGSGWNLKEILHIEVHTMQYRSIGGSSYIPLPETLLASRSIINIRNRDKKCFLWSILAHLHPAKDNPNRVSHYTPYERELNMDGISYPVKVNQIPKFELQNDVSVNVIGFDDGDFFPIYTSKHRNKAHKVDLFYITKKDNTHYCYIKNLNGLLSRTKTGNHGYKFCRNCFQGFTSQEVLDKHLLYCSKHEAQHLKFPTEGDGDIVEFDDFSKQMRVPFVIYGDFEAFALKVDTCLPNPSTSNTTTIASYEACGYGYQVVSSDPRHTKPPAIYRGRMQLNISSKTCSKRKRK